jgi:uncharacterized protein YjeT (DUF2065 family)
MSEGVWIALGLVLVLEGLGPLLAPTAWKKMMTQVSQQPDNQLRRLGGCLVVAGTVIAIMLS